MNKMKVWWHLLVLRFRLWLVQKEWGEGWYNTPITPERLWQVAYITDSFLLERVTEKQLETVNCSIRFRHAGQIFDWLSYVSGRMSRLESLEDSRMYPLQDRYIVDLDTFLVNSHGGTIPLTAFQSALKKSLDELCIAFDSVKDDGLKNHYTRKLQRLNQDIFNVQEGMLKASMLDD